MLGQLSRQHQPDCSLDLPGSHSGLLVDACQLGCLGGYLLKDVIDEGVQNGHRLGADAGVRVHLQESMRCFSNLILHEAISGGTKTFCLR